MTDTSYIEPPPAETADISARIAGYGWDEFNADADARYRAAIDAGYSQEEIDAYLGRGDAGRAQARMNADWQARVAGDEQLATGLRSVRHEAPLSYADALVAERVAGYASKDAPDTTGGFIEAPPAGSVQLDDYARGSYADAFLRNEVRSPLEWAERFVGAAWNALGDVDPAAMIRSVGQLASGLPTPEDMTDAAIALARRAGVAILPPGPAPTGGLLEQGNIDLASRPQVQTPEGGTATVRSLSIGTDKGEVLIPTVSPDGRLLSEREAIALYEETGQHLGVFQSPDAATTYAKWLHEEQANRYNLDEIRYIRSRITDAWAETGQPLMSLYERASNDPEYAASLVVPPAPEKTVWDFLAAGQEAEGAAAAEIPNAISDLFKNWYAWRFSSDPLMREKPFTEGTVEEFRQALQNVKDFQETPGFEVGMGFAGSVIARAGAKIAELVPRRMPEPEIGVLDLEKGTIEMQPISEAFADVRPAERAPAKAAAEGATPEPVSPLEFAPEAKPAEKMEALARDWMTPPERLAEKTRMIEDLRLRNEGILPDEFGPDFFTRLAAGQDAATVRLAEGMDAARGFGRYVQDTFGALIHDEGGALNMQAIRDTFKTARKQAADASYAETRDFARQLMRHGMGEVNRDEAVVARRFMEKVPNGQQTWYGAQKTTNMYKLVAPHVGEFEREIAKGPAGNPAGTVVGNLIQYMEGRSTGAVLRNSELQPLADYLRDVNQGMERVMRDAEARGLHSLTHYYQDYFRHIWKDPNAVDKAFGVGRTGSAASFKLRSIPTVMDGIRRGLEPKFTNPIELTMFDVGEKLRYLQTLEMLAEARAMRSPITNQRIVYFASKPRNPGDVALMGAGTRKTIPKAGMPDLQAYAPPGFATNWNNTVGTGFFNREFTGKLFEQLMYIKNLATQTSLAGPIYHALAITEETLATGFANAATELIGGQRFLFKGQLGKWAEEMGRGLYDLSMSATRIKAVENYIRGRQGITAYKNGASDPAVDLLTKVNFRFDKRRQEMYRMGSAPSLWESVAKGDVGNEFWRQMKYLTGDPKTETIAYRTSRALTTRLLGTVGYYAGKMWNTVAAPLFEHLIPIMKVGSGLEQMRTFLRQNPTASEELKLLRARQISDTIDNRLGELNFDNVFWPRAVKQTLQASMISPGWVYGEIRGAASALGYNLERGAVEFNPSAMATSLVGFTMAYVLSNLGYQWIKTGVFPPLDPGFSWRDALVGGRTGATTPQGADERTLLPGKQKELFDWGKIIATALYDPWKAPKAGYEYLTGKNYSVVQAIRGLISGEDRIGNKIGAQPGGYPAFLAKTLMPISINTMADRKNWTGMLPVETFLGLRQVPTFAQDPEQFYKVLEMVDRKEAQEQYRRVLRENRQLETPREVPERPPGTTDKGYPERAPTPRDENGLIVRPDGTTRGARTTSLYDVAGGDYGVLRGSGGSTGTMSDLGSSAVVLRGQGTRRSGSAAYTPWRTRSRRQRSSRRTTSLISVA